MAEEEKVSSTEQTAAEEGANPESEAESELPETEEAADSGEAPETEAQGEEPESDPEPEDTEPRQTRAEKKAAKKAAKGDREKEALKEQIETLEDKVRRQLAEFENFRTRTEREKHAMFDTGARSVLEKILPVIDNFERGLASVSEEQLEDPFVDGMNRVYKQLMTELDNIGVKPIEALGAPFDPNLHNAVMQEESEEYESGTVAKELQKGYTYHDSVIRHSMVSVVE